MDTTALHAVATLLAGEFAKGFMSESAKSAWAEVKRILGWKSDPSGDVRADAQARLAKVSDADVARVRKLLEQLAAAHAGADAGIHVGDVHAETFVQVGGSINAGQDINIGTKKSG